MNPHAALYMLAHDAMGSGLRRAYREYLALAAMPAQAIADLRERRLQTLLLTAAKTVPFYRDQAVSDPSDLRRFPVLTKDHLRERFTDFMDPTLKAEYEGRAPRARYGWVQVKTGGSTGTPTTVIHDAAFRDFGRAGRLYSQYLCGFPLGTPFYYLWGSMRDLSGAKESPVKRAMHALLRMRPMNAFLMDARMMDGYLQQMRRGTPRHLMAYVDAAAELARHAKRSGAPPVRLDTVMACAGTVTEDTRALLAEVFGARTHNKYGSRECADMACECAHGGFHVYENAVYLEIVDDNGAPVPPGATGRILVTLLHNARFPLIRYEIGDMGSWAEGACPCGSNLRMLRAVEGRSVEFLTAVDGTYVSPVFIRHVVGVVHDRGGLRRFQFVQTGPGTYTLDAEMDPSAGMDEFDRFAAAVKPDLVAALGTGARIAVQRVPRIEPSPSGKFLYVKNLSTPR